MAKALYFLWGPYIYVSAGVHQVVHLYFFTSKRADFPSYTQQDVSQQQAL
jgi:hypothetical protein